MVAGARLSTGVLDGGDGVPRLDHRRVLEARHDIAHLTYTQLVEGGLEGTLAADAVAEELVTEGHHPESLTFPDMAVKDADHGYDPTVLVEVGIEYERLERCRCIASRGRDQKHDALEQVMDALTRLAADQNGVVGGDGKVVLDLRLDLLGMRRGQVDLVDGRHDVKARVHGERRIGDRLGLHALRGVDHEDRTLTCRKGTGHLVGEVDVPRSVDEVELVGLAVLGLVLHAHGIALDGDAALALDLHGVEHLGREVTLLHRVGELEDAVRDGRLTVVDMRDDREVAYM